MSHGHNHEDYQQQSIKMGGTPGASKGLLVLCDGEAPKSGTEMRVRPRIFCIARFHQDVCDVCEHVRFTLKFQSRIGDQEVACPRWKSLDDKLDHKKPSYVHMRREICLTKAPFSYCAGCPNQDAKVPPVNEEGWYEKRAAAHGTVYK